MLVSLYREFKRLLSEYYAEMLALLSEYYAEMLALYYDANVSYHHLNKNYMWEFRIINYLGETVYESKGLRK